MTGSFTFSGIPGIHFGAGSISLLPTLISRYGKKVLLVLGSRSFQHSAHWEKLQSDFLSNKINYFIANIPNEPTPQLIDQAVNRYRKEHIDVVVSIGGGSVLDAGKAISAMLTKDDSITGYLEGVGNKVHDGLKIPFIALPTTSGTGSEATKNAVICEHGPSGFKKSLRHDNLIPDQAVVDPELTLSCPRHITARCGLDAFSQLLEAYTSTKASIITDSLALPALRCVSQSLIKACNDGQDIIARTEMAYASMISGIVLANAGLGLIHGLAGTIGGLYDMPHGGTCGTLLGVINRLNINELIRKGKESVYLDKYSEAGKIFCPAGDKSTEYYALSFADKLDELVASLSIPRFSEYDIAEPDIDKILSLSGHKNNPVKLTPGQIKKALIERL
jgi:alcohol dehydrogenase class IV